jgi:hypothetical protein
VLVFCDTLLLIGSSTGLTGYFDYFRIASQGIGLPIIPEGTWFLTELSDNVAASSASFF